jgi:membrane fusion protein, multidrug efflux system
MKIKYIVYTLITILLGYLIFNKIKKGNEGQQKNSNKMQSKDGATPPTAVKGLVVGTQDFSNDLNVSGSIEANDQVQIRSEVSGLVREVKFKEGSDVNKGDLLIKIDARELRAQLLQAETKAKLAAQIEARARKLLKSEAISQEEYENANAELRLLQAQTQLIEAQLSKTEIRAPFSGRIGLTNISIGSYITPSTEIVSLLSVNPVKITFSIPEKYAQMVKIGTEISFTTAGNSEIFTAKIYAKEPAIAVATRTLILKAKALNNNRKLLPGSFANINLPLAHIKEAILIPTEAVIPILKGKQVFICKNGLAKAVQITSEIRTDRNVLVSSGLAVGDTVLTSGIMAINPDAPVIVSIENVNKK